MCCSPYFLLQPWEDRDRQEPTGPEEEAAILEDQAREEEESSSCC